MEPRWPKMEPKMAQERAKMAQMQRFSPVPVRESARAKANASAVGSSSEQEVTLLARRHGGMAPVAACAAQWPYRAALQCQCQCQCENLCIRIHRPCGGDGGAWEGSDRPRWVKKEEGRKKNEARRTKKERRRKNKKRSIYTNSRSSSLCWPDISIVV